MTANALPMSVSLPRDLHGRISALAAADGRRTSSIAERLLRRGLAVEAAERCRLHDLIAAAIEAAGGSEALAALLGLGEELTAAGLEAMASGQAAPADGRQTRVLELALPGLVPAADRDQVRIACALARRAAAPAA